MYKNYFILNRLITELNKELSGFRIIRVFSFEKEKLVFLLTQDNIEITLEISVNAGFPYINLKNKLSIPKKNVIDFFNSYLPMEINSFEIADNDRIIRINTDKASMYFAIRGRLTNVYLISNNAIGSFRKSSKKVVSDFGKEVLNCGFSREYKKLEIKEEFDDITLIRKSYPIIGKEIVNEALFRKDNPDVQIILEIVKEIEEKNPALFIDEADGQVNLGVETFKSFSFTKLEKFENLTDAFNQLLIERFSRRSIIDKRKLIEKHLERELNKVSSKLNNVKDQIQKGSRELEFTRKANLLLINLLKISKGYDKIELPNLYNENVIVKIKLDRKLSPEKNADLYFEKARNEKIRISKMEKLFADLSKNYMELQTMKRKFLQADNNTELNSVIKELKIKQEVKKNKEEDIKNKFRHYIIHNKYDVYVGKDSKGNDLLTTKFARQNDYWFHARSVSGSHVVLRNNNPKEGIPKNILKMTASIAAFHSKAKTAGMVPVSFTQKKYVSKKKGMDPGKVVLLREDVLIVKPEIPEDCEYDS